MDFSAEHLRFVVVNLIILILSICVHEFGHAFVADKLGDRLPRSQGRVTLNPMAHADPLGTLAFPALFMLMSSGFGFGWGRPVQVNPTAFTRKLSMRKGHLLVAAAGPTMNILFGLLISLITFALVKAEVIVGGEILSALIGAVAMNFMLAVFNLIPAPPLDGGAVLEGLLPRRALPTWQTIAPYGPLILFAIIFIPGLSRIITYPAVWFTQKWMGFLLG